MKEAEWLASTDVDKIFRFLREATTLFRTRWQGHRAVPRFAFSERKSRLFAAACCRRILHLMPTDEARACVLAAEQYADGLIDDAGLSAAAEASMRSFEQYWRRQRGSSTITHPPIFRSVMNAVGRVHRQEGARAAVVDAAADAAARATMFEAGAEITAETYPPLRKAEYARQAGLLRDIVGNPFRRPAAEPAWLAWNDRCVERMARGVNDDRAFDRLPVLHDALLDAGCDDDDILAYCRTTEGHVRGCWVVDLLLGKE